MLRLVTIDLSSATDLASFDIYEAAVLSRLPEYGGRLETRLRTLDDAIEVHVLTFPDAAAYERFRADPVRAQMRTHWDRSGARLLSSVEAQSLLG